MEEANPRPLKVSAFIDRLERVSRSAVLRNLLFLAISLGFFAAILLVRSPFPFRQVSLTVRYSFLSALLSMGVLLFVLFNIRGWLGSLLSFTGVLALFALSLLALWASGQSTSTVFGGIVPIYDESGYYLDAQRLLAGGGFNQFSAYRPLFPGLLSFILWLSGNHLQLTLAVLSMIVAAACFLFAREVQRRYGPLAAVIALLILFFYYRQRISGMVMSEQLGLSLGALGLALILRATSHRQHALFLLGIFILGLGLNARPGPFFILPALLLWYAWVFRGARRLNWPVFALACLAVVASFAVNIIVQRQVQNEPNMLFSNFSYTLYGLVNGGTHFSSLFTDHPELDAIPGNERFVRAYAITLQAFLANPAGIFKGMWNEWSLFLSNTGYSVFSYMSAESPLVTTLARLGLYALSLVALIGCALKRRDPLYSLVLAAFAGVFLSVPFVPPGDAYGMRLYAATLPVIALLPALGLSFLLDRWLNRLVWFSYRPAPENAPAFRTPLAFAAILLAALTFLAPPLVIHLLARPAAIPAQVCPSEQQTIYVRLHPGSLVNVRPESEFFLDRLPDYHAGRFSQQVHGMPDPELADFFDKLDTPVSFYNTIDLASYRAAWLVFHPQGLSTQPGFYQVCGQWYTEPVLRGRSLFSVESSQLISVR